MFEWNVEDMKLLKEKKFRGEGGLLERVTLQEKLEFLDKMENSLFSYAINLVEEFNRDLPFLRKLPNGTVNTISLNAWLRKHDKRGLIQKIIIDDDQRKDIFWLLDHKYELICDKSEFNYFKTNLIEVGFCDELIRCLAAERDYFAKNDPYEVAKNDLKKWLDIYNYKGMELKTSLGIYKYDEIFTSKLNLEEINLLNDKFIEIHKKAKQILIN